MKLYSYSPRRKVDQVLTPSEENFVMEMIHFFTFLEGQFSGECCLSEKNAKDFVSLISSHQMVRGVAFYSCLLEYSQRQPSPSHVFLPLQIFLDVVRSFHYNNNAARGTKTPFAKCMAKLSFEKIKVALRPLSFSDNCQAASQQPKRKRSRSASNEASENESVRVSSCDSLSDDFDEDERSLLRELGEEADTPAKRSRLMK